MGNADVQQLRDFAVCLCLLADGLDARRFPASENMKSLPLCAHAPEAVGVGLIGFPVDKGALVGVAFRAVPAGEQVFKGLHEGLQWFWGPFWTICPILSRTFCPNCYAVRFCPFSGTLVCLDAFPVSRYSRSQPTISANRSIR